MAGSSEQEKAYKKNYNYISSINPNVRNRFDVYAHAYSAPQMESNLRELFSNYRNIINSRADQQTSDAQQAAVQSLASRGITGGSIITDSLSDIANKVNNARLDSLASLSQNEAASKNDLMRYINELNLRTTQAAQDVDFKNIANLFAKYGLLNQATGGLNDDTWLDDILAVGNTFAKIYGAVKGGSPSINKY